MRINIHFKRYLILALFFFIFSCNPSDEKKTYEYQPFSIATIEINCPEKPTDTIYVKALALTNIPPTGSKTKMQAISDSGTYHLRLYIDRPVKSQLSVGDNRYNVILYPEDTSHISAKMTESKPILRFSGKGKKINEYYLEKKKHLGYTDIRRPLNKPINSAFTYELLKKTTDSIVNKTHHFLTNYLESHSLPQWFVDYEKAEIIYSGAGFKTSLPHANQALNYFEDSVPADYYDFIEELKIDNQKAVFSTHYMWFLNDYFMMDLPKEEYQSLSGFKRVRKIKYHILKNSKKALSGNVRDIYQKTLFSDFISYFSDSSKIASLAEKFEVKNYSDLMRLANRKSKKKTEMLDLQQGDTIPNFYVINEADSLISFDKFKNQVLYINFWATWCGPCLNNMPELNKMIGNYEENSKIRFLNICMKSEEDRWRKTLKKYNLQGTNLFAKGNWNKKISAYFNIDSYPHYTIVGKDNVLLENHTDKAPGVKKKIDSLLDNE